MDDFFEINEAMTPYLEEHPIKEGDSPEDEKLWGSFYVDLRKAIHGVNAAVETGIGIDGDVPASRRAERCRELALNAKAALHEKMQDSLDRLETQLESKVSAIQQEMEKPSTEHPAVIELRHQEIRRLLMDMPTHKQADVLLNAANSGRKDILDAVKNSILPIVSDDILGRAEFEFEQKFYPSLYQTKNRNARTMEQARLKLYRVESAMFKALGVPLGVYAPKKREGAVPGQG